MNIIIIILQFPDKTFMKIRFSISICIRVDSSRPASFDRGFKTNGVRYANLYICVYTNPVPMARVS